MGRSTLRAFLGGALLGLGLMAGQARAQETIGVALQAYLDSTTESAVYNMWLRFAQARIESMAQQRAVAGIHPHITVGSWEIDIGMSEMISRLETACAQLEKQPVELTFDNRGGSIFLHPVMTTTLSTWHATLHQLLGDVGTASRSGDLPGAWSSAAHLTVSLDVPDDPVKRDSAVTICHEELTYPWSGQIERVAIVLYGPISQPAVFDLTGGEASAALPGEMRVVQTPSNREGDAFGGMTDLVGRALATSDSRLAGGVVIQAERCLVLP